MITVILATAHGGHAAGETVQLKSELAHRLVYLGHARTVPEPAEAEATPKPAKAIAKEAAK